MAQPDLPSEPHVLVTGGSGFLGRPCVDQLVARGWRVTATRRGPDHDDTDRVPSAIWRSVDLLDAEQTAALVASTRPSHLLHLAWATGHDGFRDGIENYRWIGASLDLLRHFVDHGGRRVVSVGTGAEYDWTDGGVCTETTTPLRPGSTYGLCKRTFSELFGRYLDQHPDTSGAWARLFFLYGPREDDYRLLPSIVGRLLRGEDAECRFDRLRRDYLHVDDAARGLVELLASAVEGPINVAAGEAIALGELVGRAADHLDRRDLLRLGGQPSGEHPSPVVVADIGRATDELGWRPRIDLDDGIADTVAWWRGRAIDHGGVDDG
ncbi:MAG: NAD(P)-dependent oxidoreductase [Acidobacteriota bacterium]